MVIYEGIFRLSVYVCVLLFELNGSSLWQLLDFPGGKVAFTSEMRFIPESPMERAHCYRVLDDSGLSNTSNFAQVFFPITSPHYFFRFSNNESVLENPHDLLI